MNRPEQSKSWRDVIKVHPAADLFPMMTTDELRALGEDIKKNGLQQQIVLWTPDGNYRKWSKPHGIRKLKHGEFYLLDGRNRVDALVSLDWISFDEDDGWPDISGYILRSDADKPIIFGPEVDPYHYVLSANIHRRHLTAEQKRDLIAKVLKAQPEKSNRTIAKQAKVDDKTVGSVRRELERRAEIPHVSTIEDTKGRKQPTSKKRRDIEDYIAEKEAKGVPDLVDAVRHGDVKAGEDQQLKAVAEFAAPATRPDPATYDDVRAHRQRLDQLHAMLRAFASLEKLGDAVQVAEAVERLDVDKPTMSRLWRLAKFANAVANTVSMSGAERTS